MIACLEGLYDEVRTPYLDNAAFGACYAGAVAIYLDRRLQFRPEGADWSGKLEELWSQVGRRLHERWSVARMAAAVGVSAPHLHRLCRSYLGESPQRVAQRLRMETARRALLEDGPKLQEVAQRVGYADAFAFSKAFKRRFGKSPSRFLQEAFELRSAYLSRPAAGKSPPPR